MFYLFKKSLNIAHFIGNILLVHLPDVLIPVLATGHSASPYMVFMRILSTVIHILSWYDEDPFDPQSKTHKSLMTVRRNCHMAVSRMMNKKYPREDRYWLSQFDMVMTQWSLIGIVGECTNKAFLVYFCDFNKCLLYVSYSTKRMCFSWYHKGRV